MVARAQVVGSPVRPEIRALADLPYVPPTDELRLLITGGSQGARLLSELTPNAIAQLPEALRARLSVQQQTRAESMDVARKIYDEAMIKAETAPFVRDMAGRLGAAHLVIGRAGSSTVCELAVASRPSILIPLKVALDDDQGQNAKLLVDAGGAEMLREDDLTVDSLEQPAADPADRSRPPRPHGRRRPLRRAARRGREAGGSGGSHRPCLTWPSATFARTKSKRPWRFGMTWA